MNLKYPLNTSSGLWDDCYMALIIKSVDFEVTLNVWIIKT